MTVILVEIFINRVYKSKIFMANSKLGGYNKTRGITDKAFFSLALKFNNDYSLVCRFDKLVLQPC